MAKDLITSDPSILMGKPVITGTRISVEFVLEELAAGESVEELLESHPRLSREAIQAALEYAADVLKSEVVHPISRKVA